MKLLGIDPGLTGALAVVETGNCLAAKLIDAIDTPLTGSGRAERVDVLALMNWIAQHQPDEARIERAGVMPQQGIASGFKYGRTVGAIEAAIVACKIPLDIIEPSRWKRYHRLIGKDKEASRALALRLFPSAHALLTRKKDHGRAEAALIALTGALQ